MLNILCHFVLAGPLCSNKQHPKLGPTRKLNPDRRMIHVSSSSFGENRCKSEHKQSGAAKVKPLRAKGLVKALEDGNNFDAAQIWPTPTLSLVSYDL